MKYLYTLLFLLLFMASCGNYRIDWRPDFYIADYQTSSIVNENGIRVYADSPQFNDFACLGRSKVIELMQLLMQTDLPREDKERILREVQKVYR
jgi:hypothetical protein